MNKRIIVLSLLSLITISLVFVFLKPASTSAPKSQQNTSNQESKATNPPSTMPSNPGAYVSYSDMAIAEATGTKVLFFHAPWCSQCRSIEAGIKEQGVPEGITIIKVDYDTNQALRKKYGVTLQTTFVKVDDQGEQLSKYVAYDEPTFDAVKRNFL